MRIIAGDLDDPRVIAMITAHLTRARAETAPGSNHSLAPRALQAPDITFWTVWEDDTLLGCGGLRVLSATEGEIKSMYVAEAARGKGVGAAMLRHIIAAAKTRGLARLSLETGSWAYFAPSHRLYRRHGFVPCAPFAHYAPDPNSLFMTLDLA